AYHASLDRLQRRLPRDCHAVLLVARHVRPPQEARTAARAGRLHVVGRRRPRLNRPLEAAEPPNVMPLPAFMAEAQSRCKSSRSHNKFSAPRHCGELPNTHVAFPTHLFNPPSLFHTSTQSKLA